MRLKKNRAERDKEFWDGFAQAPGAFAWLTVSIECLGTAFGRLARAAYQCERVAFCAGVNRTCERTLRATGLEFVYRELLN